jgi:hypothetical protein
MVDDLLKPKNDCKGPPQYLSCHVCEEYVPLAWSGSVRWWAAHARCATKKTLWRSGDEHRDLLFVPVLEFSEEVFEDEEGEEYECYLDGIDLLALVGRDGLTMSPTRRLEPHPTEDMEEARFPVAQPGMMRDMAKTLSFASLYCASTKTIEQLMGVSKILTGERMWEAWRKVLGLDKHFALKSGLIRPMRRAYGSSLAERMEELRDKPLVSISWGTMSGRMSSSSTTCSVSPSVIIDPVGPFLLSPHWENATEIKRELLQGLETAYDDYSYSHRSDGSIFILRSTQAYFIRSLA